MMRNAFLITTLVLFGFQAHAQNENYDYEDPQNNDYQQQTNSAPPPQYQPGPGRWKSPSRTSFNYFKASMGFAGIDDYSDTSGDLNFDSSSVLPINLGYGLSTGNLAFEAELGFAYYDYDYIPSAGSPEAPFTGDVGATKVMFNAFYKTSQTGSNLYLGGGLGLISVSLDGVDDELSGSSLATQFIIGGEIRSNEKSSLFIEYKTLSSVGLDLESAFSRLDFDYREGSLNIGVKYYF